VGNSGGDQKLPRGSDKDTLPVTYLEKWKLSQNEKARGKVLSNPRALLDAPRGRPPGHGVERGEKLGELAIVQRPEHPGFTCPQEAPAVRDQAPHGIRHARVLVPARVDAVVLRPAGEIVGWAGIPGRWDADSGTAIVWHSATISGGGQKGSHSFTAHRQETSGGKGVFVLHPGRTTADRASGQAGASQPEQLCRPCRHRKSPAGARPDLSAHSVHIAALVIMLPLSSVEVNSSLAIGK
jgi:hypothetical protein